MRDTPGTPTGRPPPRPYRRDHKRKTIVGGICRLQHPHSRAQSADLTASAPAMPNGDTQTTPLLEALASYCEVEATGASCTRATRLADLTRRWRTSRNHARQSTNLKCRWLPLAAPGPAKAPSWRRSPWPANRFRRTRSCCEAARREPVGVTSRTTTLARSSLTVRPGGRVVRITTFILGIYRAGQGYVQFHASCRGRHPWPCLTAGSLVLRSTRIDPPPW